jgi:hypothetical protein
MEDFVGTVVILKRQGGNHVLCSHIRLPHRPNRALMCGDCESSHGQGNGWRWTGLPWELGGEGHLKEREGGQDHKSESSLRHVLGCQATDH